MLQAALLAACAVLAVAWLWRRLVAPMSYWADRGVAHLPPCPLFGSFRDVAFFRKTQGEVLKEIYDRFPTEKVVGVWRLRTPLLLVRDPALARAVLQSDFAVFPGRGIRADPRDPITVHLIVMTGEPWRIVRTRLSSAFSTGRLRAMLPLLEECAAGAARNLRAAAGPRGAAVDILDTFTRYFVDTIGTCGFGLQFSSVTDPKSPFAQMGRRITDPKVSSMLRRLLRLSMPGLVRILRLKQFPQDLCNYFQAVVSGELRRRAETGEQRIDIMQQLLNMQQDALNHNGSIKQDGLEMELTEELLAAQAFLMFSAGFESPRSSVLITILELARQPALQRRAREDVLSAMALHPPAPGQPGRISYEALQAMSYLDMVVSESLRLYPVGVLLFRESVAHYRLPGTDVQLEPGCQLIVNLVALHRDPSFWPDPERFDPERFSPENKKNIKPFTYMPFGAGPRFCIAQRFAWLQMKVMLAHLLLDFDVKSCAQTMREIKFDPRIFVLMPVDPVVVWLQPRPEPAAALS